MKKFLLSLLLSLTVLIAASPAHATVCNLFDKTNALQDDSIWVDYRAVNRSGYYGTNTIPVIGGQTYTRNGAHGSANYFLLSDGTWIDVQNSAATITVPENATMWRFNNATSVDRDTAMVVQGDTLPSSYVPYNPLCATCQGIVKTYESATGTVTQNGTPTPTNPIEPTFYQQGDMVLRKVGDVADSYDATTGKITRRVGVKVLDGTENWAYNSAFAGYEISFDLSGNNLDGLCNIVPIVKENSYMSSVRLAYNQIRFQGMQLLYAIADDWKSYLTDQYNAGTPVTVYYPLATPVEETVTQTTYCADPIKIATTAYNAAAFAPVEQALESAVTTIKDVVANTIVQADAIQNLQDAKQTRPDAECPRFRQCLLIETDDGTPQWFPIIDPFKDFVTPILANNANITPVDAQSRYYGDQQLCTALAGTEFAKCTNDQAATSKIAASYNTEHGALKENEWGYEFKAANIGANPATDNPNNDEGIVYGISKCVSSSVQTNYVNYATKLDDVPSSYQTAIRGELERKYDYSNPTYGVETYTKCWCKATGIAYGGQYYETSAAPWLFNSTYGSAADCARSCAVDCAVSVRYRADFRSAVLGWAVE